MCIYYKYPHTHPHSNIYTINIYQREFYVLNTHKSALLSRQAFNQATKHNKSNAGRAEDGDNFFFHCVPF